MAEDRRDDKDSVNDSCFYKKMATSLEYKITPNDLSEPYHPGEYDAVFHEPTFIKESLFALTILSGNKEAVEWAANFVKTHAKDEVWHWTTYYLL